MKKVVTAVVAWTFVAFSLTSIPIYGFCTGTLLLLIAAVLALPLKPIRKIWNKLLNGHVKWMKPALFAVVFFIAVFLLPNKEIAHLDSTDSGGENSTVISTESVDFTDAPVISSNEPEAPSKEPETSSEEQEASSEEPEVSSESHQEPEVLASSKTETQPTAPTPSVVKITIKDIPAYSGSRAYVAINGNKPYFSDTELTTKAFESYSALDSLGRCGVAYANICVDIMPTEERGSIGQVKPSGWHTVKYDCVDGKYLYNRCHLIGYQLSAENANTKNLITGTRYMNVEGMLPFENMVADYIKETGNHVLYRVTPIFEGNNLVATGVLIEALSVEDKGDGICFNVFCYNVQPGIIIDYATGDSKLVTGDTAVTETPVVTAPETTSITSAPTQPTGITYILNTNTHKFHKPSCSSVDQMNEENKQEYTGNRNDLIEQGYDPCGRCNP